MNVIMPVVKCTRTCDWCQKEAETDDEAVLFFDQDKCRFNYVWVRLKKYDDLEIKLMLIERIPKFRSLEFNRAKWQFQLCKIMVGATRCN